VSLPAEDAVEIELLTPDEISAEPSFAATETVPFTADGAGATAKAFHVRLENFEGPFDLLLSLITRRQMDVTEVALSQVTDEFIAHLSAMEEWDLGQATEFLVVASTLLDLKAARLLPAAEVEDDEDLALLEARDLLFARLLQYRAYKLAAAYLGELERAQSKRHGRAVELEDRFAQLLPEVFLDISPQQLAQLAAVSLRPRPEPVVAIDHVHVPRVSVREHMAIVRDRLRRAGSLTFRALTADCASTLEVVARFLGLLELYRDGVIAFDQAAALSELRVRWTAASGSDDLSEDESGEAGTGQSGESGDPGAQDPDTREAHAQGPDAPAVEHRPDVDEEYQ
jgi:segregation and condensation protein A